MDAVIDSVGRAQVKGRVRFCVVAIRTGEAFAGMPGICEGTRVPVPCEGGSVKYVGRGMRALRAALAEAHPDGVRRRDWTYRVSVYDPGAGVWWPCELAGHGKDRGR